MIVGGSIVLAAVLPLTALADGGTPCALPMESREQASVPPIFREAEAEYGAIDD
jgi:hypothetical protein